MLWEMRNFRSIKGWFLFVFVIATLSIAPTVLAGPGRGARALKKGVKLYEAARFKRSLHALTRALRRALGAKMRGQVHLYVGLNHSVLGHKEKAVGAFREALLADPAIDLDPARFKPGDIALFERAKGALKGTLEVTATRGTGAMVLIDGKARGKVPLTVSLPVGRHDVVVRRGTDLKRRVILIGHGGRERVDMTFAPLPPKPKGVTLPSPKSAPRISVQPSAWSFGWPRLWTWVSLGLAAAAGGTAIAVGLMAKSDADAYATTQDSSEADSLKQSAQTKMLVSNIMIGVVGAAAIATIVVYYFEGRAGRNEASAKETARVAGRRVSVGLTGLKIVF